jgi:hypothetical protein
MLRHAHLPFISSHSSKGSYKLGRPHGIVWKQKLVLRELKVLEMAVVLRSKTDLVYLPDHGFVGEEGGKRLPTFP